MLIFIIIVIAVVVFIVKGKRLGAARARNSIVSWATGEEGFCLTASIAEKIRVGAILIQTGFAPCRNAATSLQKPV